MRVLGFSKLWDKLNQNTFTTFRFKRRDADWAIGETVKVVYQPRRKGGGEFLGIAEIVGKEPRRIFDSTLGDCPVLTNEEAITDGFDIDWAMIEWLDKTYGIRRLLNDPMVKLTLCWEKQE